MQRPVDHQLFEHGRTRAGGHLRFVRVSRWCAAGRSCAFIRGQRIDQARKSFRFDNYVRVDESDEPATTPQQMLTAEIVSNGKSTVPAVPDNRDVRKFARCQNQRIVGRGIIYNNNIDRRRSAAVFKRTKTIDETCTRVPIQDARADRKIGNRIHSNKCLSPESRFATAPPHRRNTCCSARSSSNTRHSFSDAPHSARHPQHSPVAAQAWP